MRKITDIYKEYKIILNLQEHMLRVAAVAALICDNFSEPLNKKEIITAGLLHDMGNIIKFELDIFLEFLEPEGLEFWQKVQDEYKEKYGDDECVATEAIAREINISEKCLIYIKNIGFSNSTQNEQENIFEHKICNYADMRVDPHGIVSMEERVLEGHRRYEAREHAIVSNNFETLTQSMRNMEKQIFSKCKIRPEDINNESIKLYIEKLKDFEI